MAEGSSEWSDPLPEIVGRILRRLPHPRDRIRFSVVCRAWRCALLLQPPTPWMVLTPDAHRKSCCFFCLSDKTLYTLPFPEADDGARLCGSFCDWLVVAHREDNGHHLLNLFSGAKTPLPRRTRTIIRTHNPFDVFGPGRVERESTVRKAILSSSSSSSDQAPLVVVTLHTSLSLSICSPQATAWTSYPSGPLFIIHDIVFYKGMLYAVNYDGQVYIIDVGGGEQITSAKSLEIRQTWRAINNTQITSVKSLEIQQTWTTTNHAFLYLIECCGRLLMVHRHWKFKDPIKRGFPRSTTGFQVFEAQPDRWVEVKSFGGHALFLSAICSKSLLATQCVGVNEDCIYFTADNSLLDSGMFSMADGSTTELLHTTLASRLGCQSSCSPPQWLHFTYAS